MIWVELTWIEEDGCLLGVDKANCIPNQSKNMHALIAAVNDFL